MAYWSAARNVAEARYLCALLNSDTARLLIAPMQPKGQGGARHFDNLIWELSIPEYDRHNSLHQELAAAASIAEQVAAGIPLPEGAYYYPATPAHPRCTRQTASRARSRPCARLLAR